MSKKRKRKGHGPRSARVMRRDGNYESVEGVLHRLCLDALQRGCGIVLTCDSCWAEAFDIVEVRGG